MAKKSNKKRFPIKKGKSKQTNIFLKNSKRMLSGGIILGVLGIIATIYFALFPNPIRDFIIERWGNPLEINPAEKEIRFSADGNNWNEDFFVYLINKTSNSYYDINITSEFPNPIDISVLPVDSNEFSTINSGNGTISIGSDFMIAGEIKEKGTEIIQTVINNIGPNETKKIKVAVNKKNYNQNFRLEFKVSGFNKTPKPIFNK